MSSSAPVGGPVVLVGCGRLGSAILEGWLLTETVAPADLIVLSPSEKPAAEAARARGARINPPLEALTQAAVVVLAVKPAIWRDVMAPLAPFLNDRAVILSVMAGVTAPTLAEGIAVKQVGDLSYAIARPLIDEVLLIEEPHFERAVALYCNVEKTVVEGAGAASLAALLAYPGKFKGKKVGLIVTGGNIDTRLLASVLTRELVRDQRLVSLRIIGDDRPGLLATVSAVIGQMGANIIEVAHNRLALDVPAKGAEFDIMIETRDAQHTQEIMDALREHGYPPRAV